jgi:hypothetical protein
MGVSATYPYGLMERSGKNAKTNLPLNRLTTSKISLGETWSNEVLATKHCQQNGNWACAWTFHAASTVIARPIKSVYPVVNGPSDAYIRIFNTTFKPRGSRSRIPTGSIVTKNRNSSRLNSY